MHRAALRHASRGTVERPSRSVRRPAAHACRVCKPFGLRVCAAFGGLQKHGQKRELQAGVEAAIATPGRLIDLVECGACSLQRLTVLVIDEVDRCFDLGFEPQVRGSLLLGSVALCAGLPCCACVVSMSGAACGVVGTPARWACLHCSM